LGAIALLIALSIIDLRHRLLPNEMVAGFATLGFVFHLTTLARFVPIAEIFIGGIIGFGTLYLVRAAANYLYKTDALGLGDVKLMGAGGIWLGPDMIMLALSIGAIAGLVHGMGHAFYVAGKTGTKPEFARLQIPAGPGFAAGIIIVGIVKFWHFSPF
jgi:leader peptidase (prepilin peptidase)/N-methyltransferase